MDRSRMVTPSAAIVLQDHIGSSISVCSGSVVEGCSDQPVQYAAVGRKRKSHSDFDHAGYSEGTEGRADEVDDQYLSEYRAQAKRYVDNIAQKYAGRLTSLTRPRTLCPDGGTNRAVRARLTASGVCDIRELACIVSMCGRVFESLQVLAFHVSYAHHDLSSSCTKTSQCLVCGLQLQNTKGKTAHLMTKHRVLAEEHNMQCLQQRDTVISPHAPAALRLQYEMTESSAVYQLPPEVVSQPFIVYDQDYHDSDEDI